MKAHTCRRTKWADNRVRWAPATDRPAWPCARYEPVQGSPWPAFARPVRRSGHGPGMLWAEDRGAQVLRLLPSAPKNRHTREWQRRGGCFSQPSQILCIAVKCVECSSETGGRDVQREALYGCGKTVCHGGRWGTAVMAGMAAMAIFAAPRRGRTMAFAGTAQPSRAPRPRGLAPGLIEALQARFPSMVPALHAPAARVPHVPQTHRAALRLRRASAPHAC